MINCRVVAPMGVTLHTGLRLHGLAADLLDHRTHLLKKVGKGVHEVVKPVGFVKDDILSIDGDLRGPITSQLVETKPPFRTVGEILRDESEAAAAKAAGEAEKKLL